MKVFHISMLICAVCCLAVPVHATSSRVASMGGGDDYFEDVNNVLRWYGSLASYGGTAFFEFGDESGQFGNIHRRAAAVLAELGTESSLGVGGLFLFGNDPDDVTRVAWGKSLGALQVGFQWRLYWGDRYWSDLDSPSYTSRDIYVENQGFGVGARLELDQRTYADIATEIVQTVRGIEISDWEYDGVEYDWNTFSTRMRVFHGVSDMTAVVPMIEFAREIHPDFVRDYTDYYDRDVKRYTVGLGWNHLPDSDTMLVGSFTYRYTDTTLSRSRLDRGPDAVTSALNDYTFRFGVERRMLSWLTLRAGVWQTLWRENGDERATFSSSWTSYGDDGDSLEINLGLAVHIGPFDADFVFQEYAPFNIGSIISQSRQDRATWNMITLQYVF